ncbi:endonuclease/exonuclease/phosphatase family protein, partial [Streptomyces microflavus]|uniref:endonuclease/exonuclease/phosphatase family protein n=1 Tax=Streptomyces microflavus TaxID=1919 RepID=UPI0034102475
LAVAPGLAWAVVRLAGLDRGPLVQALAFTPYVAGWSLLVLTLTLALRRRWPAVAAAVAALALVGAVAPRALPTGQPTVDGPELRLLTANLLKGGADAATLVELVRRHRVDVLTVQEFTPAARDALDRAGLAGLLPHRQLNPEVGTTGSGLYARFPLSDGGFRRNAGFAFTQAYATVAVPDAPPLRVESAHPAAPWSVEVVGEWRTDLAGQPRATPDGQLGILAGDFNATLDHAPLRALLASGYSHPPPHRQQLTTVHDATAGRVRPGWSPRPVSVRRRPGREAVASPPRAPPPGSARLGSLPACRPGPACRLHR